MQIEEREQLIKAIYDGVRQPIPAKAVQTKEFGNKTNGYIIGYLVKLLNSVLAPLGCTWETRMIPFETSDGHARTYIVDQVEDARATVSVQIRFMIFGPDGEVLITKDSFGGIPYVNRNLGDTLKGAQTDALKKAFSYIGLGNDAYCGLIDEQLLGYKYQEKAGYRKITKLVTELTGKEPDKDQLFKTFKVICEKEFANGDQVEIEDIEMVIAGLEKKIKEKKGKPKRGRPKKNEQEESDSGKDKAEAPEPRVDKSDETDDEPPF